MNPRTWDKLAAAGLVVGFGGMFLGRVVMYPVALAPGGTLERVRAEPVAWDVSHRIMTVGVVAVVCGVAPLARRLAIRSPWLAVAGGASVSLAAVLSVGQYALDYAILAAAELDDPSAAEEFVARLRGLAFVDWAYYRVANPAWVGAAALAGAMWRQAPRWRAAAILIASAVVVAAIQARFGPIGPRIALGLQFAGFAAAAWRLIVDDGSVVSGDA